MHSLIIITHSCIQKTQRPQQTGSRGNGTRSTRSKKLLLKNYTTNTNTDTHTHTHQYTSTSESTLEAQTATKTMSVVDVFSFFIYQPAKIGSTIKVRTARVKCQRPAWPPSTTPLPLPSLTLERETRAGQFPLANFVIGQANVLCCLLLSLSLVLLPPLPPSLFPPLLVAVVSPFVCLSVCPHVALSVCLHSSNNSRGNGNGNGSN